MMKHEACGQCILVAWAGAISHVATIVEAAYLEGFSAAQLGTADALTAWDDSDAKMIRDANLRVSEWAVNAATGKET